jgi:hypothetical protein
VRAGIFVHVSFFYSHCGQWKVTGCQWKIPLIRDRERDSISDRERNSFCTLAPLRDAKGPLSETKFPSSHDPLNS